MDVCRSAFRREFTGAKYWPKPIRELKMICERGCQEAGASSRNEMVRCLAENNAEWRERAGGGAKMCKKEQLRKQQSDCQHSNNRLARKIFHRTPGKKGGRRLGGG